MKIHIWKEDDGWKCFQIIPAIHIWYKGKEVSLYLGWLTRGINIDFY